MDGRIDPFELVRSLIGYRVFVTGKKIWRKVVKNMGQAKIHNALKKYEGPQSCPIKINEEFNLKVIRRKRITPLWNSKINHLYYAPLKVS